MTHYSRNSSCAFTWDKSGECHAVLIARKGDRCVVTAHWHGSAGKNTSIAESLTSAKRTLGSNESIITLAGGCDSGWGMADVEMPELKNNELKNALAFELRKHTPIPTDKLLWGYRVINTNPQTGKLLVRLFYVRTETWRQWTDAVGGIGQVDMILPPPVALDPLLAEQTATIPGDNLSASFVFTPGPAGRMMAPINLLADTTEPRALKDLLPLENLTLGSIADLPAAEQLHYAGAILLAVYGLTRELNRDLATVIRVPEPLRPRRYRGSQLLASLLAFYICAGLCFGSVRAIQNRIARLRHISSELSSVETQITSVHKQLNPTNVTFANSIKQELNDVISITPRFPNTLLELTRLIDAPSWMSSRLEWKDGQVSFQLQEVDSDLELATRLEHSPLLGDVRELSSSFDPRENRRIRKFLLNARFDTDKEKQAALTYSEEQAAKKQRLADEKEATAERLDDEAIDTMTPTNTPVELETVPDNLDPLPPPPPPLPNQPAQGEAPAIPLP